MCLILIWTVFSGELCGPGPLVWWGEEGADILKKTHKKQVSDNKNESQNLIGGYEVRLNHYLDLYNA